MNLIERFAAIGTLPDDGDDERIRKGTLTVATGVVCALSPIWVVTYLLLDLPVPAAIPSAYLVITAISLLVYRRTKRFGVFRTTQLGLMLVLPFALQWSLGGFVPSSGVALWALCCPLGALTFAGTRQAGPWFVAYLSLIGISLALEPLLQPADVPEAIQIAFFAGNVTGVSLTAYLLLQYFVREREREHARSEGLLLNVLPAPVAARLKHDAGVIADRFDAATVLFADIVDFTPMSAALPAEEVVELLNAVFSDFDRMIEERGLEKIKTIGDAYMVASGIPVPRPDHAQAIAELALEMRRAVSEREDGLRLRIGIDTGPVVAGVIGRRKFIYDLWGDTVNTASRMESHGVPGEIQVTERVVAALDGGYRFDARGSIDVKGKGSMPVWILRGRASHTG
ncbi:MAG: adenylate/guanylate cyclase domain-containing protein [Actinomycetota bacterium]